MTAKVIQKYSKKSFAQLLSRCQVIFNKWIRERDKEETCISCPAGRVEQAGHFLSQGHHSALRFDEDNTNGQCVRCNHFLSGNLLGYRKGLIKKIGEVRVLALENYPKKAHKWDRFTLIEKIEKYGKKEI